MSAILTNCLMACNANFFHFDSSLIFWTLIAIIINVCQYDLESKVTIKYIVI